MKDRLAIGALLCMERHWKRKHTIATNKLAKIRKEINDSAVELEIEVMKGRKHAKS